MIAILRLCKNTKKQNKKYRYFKDINGHIQKRELFLSIIIVIDMSLARITRKEN